MPRRPLALLVALATALSLSACSTTYIINGHGNSADDVSLGWHKITPVAIKLPTDDPLGSATAPDLTGPLIVNIWASWCDPCKAELPLLQKLDADHTIAVVGFTRDIKSDKAESALSTAGVTYPNWMDSEAKIALAMDGKVPINAVPSSLLIRDGKVVAVHIGEFKKASDVLEGEKL